jgi:sugar O-acyltransferase (sialic acid O-acetyltransferase NeuD family)
MKKKIILIGAGGHAKSCIDIINAEGKYEIIGLVDNKKKKNSKIFNYKVLGNDKILEQIRTKVKFAFLAVGQIKTHELRKKLYLKAINLGFEFPKIISPSSIISPFSKIGKGCLIAHGVKINSNAKIGINSIINTNAIIEHDVLVGDFCHVSTSSTVNGNVEIGNNSFIGSGSILKNSIKIKNGTILPMGSIVKKNI